MTVERSILNKNLTILLRSFECRLTKLLRNSRELLSSYIFHDEDTEDNSVWKLYYHFISFYK